MTENAGLVTQTVGVFLQFYSINLHFSFCFRHSIFLDSYLFKFSFRFFFNQTSMNVRAKAMVVTQMQPVSTLLALITARVGQATKGMG